MSKTFVVNDERLREYWEKVKTPSIRGIESTPKLSIFCDVLVPYNWRQKTNKKTKTKKIQHVKYLW